MIENTITSSLVLYNNQFTMVKQLLEVQNFSQEPIQQLIHSDPSFSFTHFMTIGLYEEKQSDINDFMDSLLEDMQQNLDKI